LVSKKARQHYKELQHETNHYLNNLKEKRYKGPEDLSKRQNKIKRLEEKVVSRFKKEIKVKEHTIETITSILDAIKQAVHTKNRYNRDISLEK
jgi:sugar-specific transcriptional regulator TrmB